MTASDVKSKSPKTALPFLSKAPRGGRAKREEYKDGERVTA